MTKKIIGAIALLMAVAMLFSGCSMDSLFNIDLNSYDPAIETVADILDKPYSEEGRISGDFTYNLLDDGRAVVTKYSGKSADLAIPEELDGHSVAGLENKALYQSQIKSLVFPDSLEVVGNYAVMYCHKLEKVVFGKGIRHIGVSAFECQGNNSKSEGSGVLKKIVFNGVPETIAEKAFYYCDKLTEIVLPDGVKTIGPWAFAKCWSAERIILGEGLESIGDHAFLKCRKAEEISIPGSCKTIEASAFYQCQSLKKLTLNEGIEVLKKGAFEECSSLTSVTVPNSVTLMETYIFYNCTSLKECTFGDKINDIGKDIFTGDKDVTVFAPADSAIEKYARTNGLNFSVK